MSLLTNLVQKTNQLKGKKDQLDSEYKKERKQVRQLKKLTEVVEKALALTQIVAQQTQEELEYRISDIVTTALSSVFPDPYEFKVHFEIKRGKTEAKLVFSRDGEELDPLTASGGGVVDVASFALRLSCYLLQPQNQRVMILDEPFRFVSKEFLPAVSDLIEELSEKLDIQFIIVTHEEELKIGNIIEWEN